MGEKISRLQEYYGFHWNEIGRPQCLGEEVIYHFQRQQDQPLPMTFQVRSIHTDEIVKEFLPPYHCSGWRSCKGQAKVVFAGQCDIADDPDHQNRPSGSSIHWQPVWVMVYDGSEFRFITIPNTDTINEFYSVTYNPDDDCFYAGETDRAHGPSDWSNYPNGGGVWRSPDGLNWKRIWEDPDGRVISVNVINDEVYATCMASQRSIYKIYPEVEHILDFNVNDIPFHAPEYTWKGRMWASGLVSFDGQTIRLWDGELPAGPIYPVGVDNDNLLVRIAKEDYSSGGYTIGRIREINGAVEYIADNWMLPHAIDTCGGAVSINGKLYLGLFRLNRGVTVYGCLDKLCLAESSDGEKMTDLVKIVKQYNTDEDLNKLIKHSYRLFLDRNPDPTGIQSFKNTFNKHGGDIYKTCRDFNNAVILSPEFRNKTKV